MNISELVYDAFEKRFCAKPAFLVRAPGRVNLIGEHTDYNEGFVLPMAIDRAIWIALRPRSDRRVRVHSLDYGDALDFSLEGFEKGQGWGEYVKGVAWALDHERGKRKDEKELSGWDGVVGGDVPKGAGLSSSAALELAAARAFAAVSGFDWEAARMARVGQMAENAWVGVQCGVMDQMACAASRQGHALFLDCRSLDYEHVPLPEGIAVVVLDTSTRRGLVDSAYNERREQCEAAARFFGVKALRDVGMEEFEKERGKMKEEAVMRRARHIVSENKRVLEAARAMRQGDAAQLGALFDQSHASLRDDFEVSSAALDQIVEAAQAQAACYGARMTGAGFGGCAVALVKREGAGAFTESVSAAYRQKSGLEARVYVCQASQGASVVAL
ncbi:MAG: galactokinase [Chloroflexota bacterium]